LGGKERCGVFQKQCRTSLNQSNVARRLRGVSSHEAIRSANPQYPPTHITIAIFQEIFMINKTAIASLILAVALPLAAMADAPHKANGNAVRANPPASQTPPHHKVRCCSGRMQAQPRPAH
jgi:hypothetical protein